jgi:hypothetical protein
VCDANGSSVRSSPAVAAGPDSGAKPFRLEQLLGPFRRSYDAPGDLALGSRPARGYDEKEEPNGAAAGNGPGRGECPCEPTSCHLRAAPRSTLSRT